MINITQKNYVDLIKGASLFTTGGGIAWKEQVFSLEIIENLKVKIKAIHEFPQDGYLLTASEIGPADAVPFKKKKLLKTMFDLLQKNSNKKIVGLYPVEIGQESIVLETAHYLNLPIADFDAAGFRAVPFVDINIFALKNIPIIYNPIVLTNGQEIFLIESNMTSNRYEEILRNLISLSKNNIVFALGELVLIKDLLKHKFDLKKSYSKALEYGKIKNLQQVIESIKPNVEIYGKIIELKEKEKKGFLYKEVILQDKYKVNYKLVILNEILFIIDSNNKIIASPPDKILLIDHKTLVGFSSGNLDKFTEVLILIKKAEKIWYSEKGIQLFGIERFKNLLSSF